MIFSDKYQPLWSESYRYAIVSGGRGSAKSFTVQTFLRDLTYQDDHKIALTRYTMTSAEKSVIPEFTEKLVMEGVEENFDLVGKTYKNLKSESELSFMGLKTSSGVQTASLKSIHGLTTWYMEEAEELVDDGTEDTECTFDKIDNSIRVKGVDLRTILTWNPSTENSFVYKRFFEERGLDITFNGVYEDTLYIYTTYEDNLENLHQSFIDKAETTRRTRPARYNHIYKGIPIKNNPDALWNKDTMISPYRTMTTPDLVRICVAVDPAVTSNGNQDETGIVVSALGADNHFYVFEDASKQMSVADWAKVAVAKFKDHQANYIIGETNNGGDLIAMNITTVMKHAPIKTVHAKKGKILRAEPVSILYEQGKVHHVGQFPELEMEMCEFTGKVGESSPNRLDALVYSIMFLAHGGEDAEIFVDF